MAEIRALDDPCWATATQSCVRCGYDLTGLAVGRTCPECGFGLAGGVGLTGNQFIICGVPSSRSVMSRWRIAAIMVLALLATFLPQVLVVMGLFVSWRVSFAGFGIFACLVVWLVVSAPRSQGGTGRMIFGSGGVCLLPLKVTSETQADLAQTFIALQAPLSVSVSSVSDVWAKLRIDHAGGRPFQAGIRCPRWRTGEVQTTLTEVLGPPVADAGPDAYSHPMNGPTTPTTTTTSEQH